MRKQQGNWLSYAVASTTKVNHATMVTTGLLKQLVSFYSDNTSLFMVTLWLKRKVTCYQLELENNLPTFQLNVPVVVRAKLKKYEWTLQCIAIIFGAQVGNLFICAEAKWEATKRPYSCFWSVVICVWFLIAVAAVARARASMHACFFNQVISVAHQCLNKCSWLAPEELLNWFPC